MTPAVRTRLIVGLLLLGVLAAVFGAWVMPRVRVETDLLELLPQHTTDERIETAVDEFSARLSRKVLLLIGAGDSNAASVAARTFAARLKNSAAFVTVREQTGEDLQAIERLYLDHRASLISRHDYQLLEVGGAEALYRAALQALYTPVVLMRPFDVARDPVGLGSGYLLEQLPVLGNARLKDSQLVVNKNGKTYVLVIAETAGSPFSVAVQDRTQTALNAALVAARMADGSELTLLQSGVLQHATVATRVARKEVTLFGTIGTVAVLTLMLALFRDWRAPALGMLALTAGAWAGISATHFAFGEMHLIALVFGSSLIGVAIDYSLHFYTDQFRDPRHWIATDALAHVGRPIVLGLGATLLGYAGLLWLPFPGLKQMALISMAGLVVACTCVFLIYPALARGSGRDLPLWCAALIDGLERLGSRLASRPVRVVIALALVGALGFGLQRVEFRDDIRALQKTPPQLAYNERQVSELLGTANESRYFLVSGTDAEAVLVAEERLAARLSDLKRSGALDGYNAVTNSLPSLERQQVVRALLAREVYSADGALPRLMRKLGFDAEAVARQQDAFARAQSPLQPAEWLANPISTMYRDLWLGNLGGRFATIITLSGVHDIATLRSVARQLPDVRFVDRVAEVSAVLSRYRSAVLGLLFLAYVVIFVALTLRYGVRDAGWLVAAPLGASALTLSFSGVIGLPVNLFAALGLLLLLALGVDYAIFLREARDERRTAILAVSLSALTTMLSFGLLAFSSTPLIHSIGLTLLVGIGCCWLIAVGGDAWRRTLPNPIYRDRSP